MPASEAVHIDARGMKCPWPALRVARAMRSADAVTIEADDPIAPVELEALARQQGWTFIAERPHLFALARSL
ncbi:MULTISPECIES: sulfurtransferase TusA family protein [Sphingobium]|jgi:tRNA 2-thiouridine synthesizing protein A|uniref:Sulfurtransferase TusA family protein n=2 Tax=Sphingobium fuliginis (strain ATCC 27551) TaxID=336203 RepID=A0A4Q4J0J9_SPHSA|nr:MULTISPECIES: sulfurtransferase TusA family protein [Sphingobium]OAP29526.1 redox protein [Sphingobium sp. 20006FA]AJR24769.1 redox protein [Sphingobium sp. YBL2]KXU29690.1 redox protein [Sphingobium sp. AM]KYC29922.1 redox protein [Sphingobium sp. 22B]PNQ01794.1 redox protein [Sphingobium sp. SA916]